MRAPNLMSSFTRRARPSTSVRGNSRRCQSLLGVAVRNFVDAATALVLIGSRRLGFIINPMVGWTLRVLALVVPVCVPAFGCSPLPVEEDRVGQTTQSLLRNASCELGIPDLSGTVCCDTTCGKCEESGCSGRSGGASRCCPSQIRSAEVACAHNPAPCVQDSDPACVRGIPNSTGTVCCPDFCGECGGDGCSSRRGGNSLCCTGGITGSDAPSCGGGSAPCVMDSDPLCAFGIERNGFCCDAACGAC